MPIPNLYGEDPTWDEVSERLGRQSLGQVLDVVAKASVVLDKLEAWKSFDGQNLLIGGLFGEQSAEVRQTLARWWRQQSQEERPRHLVLFHELQIINTVKIALLTIPPDASPHDGAFDALGEALLMVNDLIGRGDENELTSADPSTPEGMRRWHQYLLMNGLFHTGDNRQHALARGYDLYLSDRLHLRDCGSYVDLPALVEELTGFSPDLLWMMLFSLYAHWGRIDLKNVDRASGAIDMDTYFTGKLRFSREEVDRFFSLVAVDAGAMRGKLLEAGFGPESLRPFEILPFEDKPLIIVDRRAYCISVRLLLRKMTRGLHYIFLNRIEDEAERQRYLTYMGVVFGDYVDGVLKRAYPPLTRRYVDERTLKERAPEGAKVCDGVLIYPDVAVLIESKATLFTAAVRAAGDWGQYEAKIKDIFVDAAEQIEDTVQQIEAGRFVDLGLDPARLRVYLPLVVTLEDVPVIKPVYEKICEEIEQNGLFQHSKIRALQAI
ncbi:MAG: hypothetical protein V3U43_03885, partial [Pseudomonadales bacterium]